MAVDRVYTYLGQTDKGYQIWEGLYTALNTDQYSRANRITLTFAGMAQVKGILGITGLADDVGNLGNPVELASIVTNVVTLVMLETAAQGAALAEKTNAEAYGDALAVKCTVYGL